MSKKTKRDLVIDSSLILDLEEITQQVEGVEFGIEEVEIVDQKLLDTIVERKRGAADVWKPKKGE